MGRIITFYSYKGGTGRSMALANLAWILASNGKTVLMVDWDLEAPGLHRYFAPFLVDKELQFSKGVIDAVVEFSTRALTPMPEDSGDMPWYSDLADVENYVVAIDWPRFEERDGKRGRLDLFPSGQQSPGYGTRVNSFNWDNFYERLGGGVFLEAMKQSMASTYDYTLIDSRTGVSDTSGICTVQFPDAVVICFTLNNQGIEGAAGAAQAIAKHHTDSAGRQLVPVYPVPMRVDPFESDRVELRRAYARRKFHDLIAFLGDGADRYWEAVEVPYRSLYAYEEVLACFGDRAGDPKTVLASFERLTEVITGKDVTRMPPVAEEERLRIRAAFAAVPDAAVAATSHAAAKTPVASAQTAPAAEVYLSYPADAGSSIELIQQRLRAWNVQWTSTSESEAAWASAIRARIGSCRAFIFFITAAGLNRWQKRELAVAREYQQIQNGSPRPLEIIPILLPGADPKAAARDFPLYRAVELNPSSPGDVLETLVRGLRNPQAALSDGVSPYVSDAFPENAEKVFFGRERLATEITITLTEAPMVVLQGPAGAGKTSLVQAGIVPQLRRLQRPRWEIASMTPGFDPFGNLVQALQSAPAGQVPDNTTLLANAQLAQGLVQGSVRLDSLLEQVFKAMPNTDRLLLVVDDLEDLLRSATPAEQQLFMSCLSLAQARFPLALLFIVREDQAAPFAELWKRSSSVQVRRFHISPMEEDDLRIAADKLESLGQVMFEAGAKSRLVELAQANPAVLSAVFKEGFERPGTDPISVADVERIAAEVQRSPEPLPYPDLKAADAYAEVAQDLSVTQTFPVPPNPPGPPSPVAQPYRPVEAVSVPVRAAAVGSRKWLFAGASLVVVFAALFYAWTSSRRPAPAPLVDSAAFDSGVRAMNEKQFKEAAGFFTSSINTGGMGLEQRAYAYRELSDYKSAREDLNQLIQRDPKNAQYFRDRAYINRLLGRYDDAMLDYGQALDLAPDATTYRDRAYLYTLLRQDDRALEDLSRALNLNGDDAEASAARAVLYIRQGKNDQAIKDLDQALRINPKLDHARVLLDGLRKRTPQRARVVLHVPSEAQISDGLKVKDILEKQRVLADAPEVVASDRAPNSTRLRFFRMADQKEAEILALTLSKAGFETTAELFKDIKGSIPPPRQFEWWMALKYAPSAK